MAISAYNNVLHTDSSYADGINLSFLNSTVNKYDSDIAYLKSQEEKVYAKLGARDFYEFRDTIRNIFCGKRKRDRDCFKNFSKENLDKTLSQLSSAHSAPTYYDVQLPLVINLNQPSSDKKIDFSGLSFNSEGVQGSAQGILRINLSLQPNVLKGFMNSISKDHNRFGEKRNDAWVRKAFIDFLENNPAVTIADNSSIDSIQEVLRIRKSSNFPWSFKSQDIKNLSAEDSSILIQLGHQALDEIQDYILNVLCANGSEDLYRAAYTTFRNSLAEAGAWTNTLKFFSKGDAARSVGGALGEFQDAMFWNYIQIVCKVEGYDAAIFGNIFQKSEQMKTDVQILGGVGIQVKNFKINENYSFINTTIHPDKFASYFSEGQSFLDFIANHYFNKDYTVDSNLTDTLNFVSNKIGALFNMAVNDSVGDTVSFYHIAGTSLVPGSVILESISNGTSSQKKTYITGPKIKYDNNYFKEKEKINGRKQPRSVLYWKNGNFSSGKTQPTHKNLTDFSNLVGRSISIRSGFDYISILKSDDFNIF